VGVVGLQVNGIGMEAAFAGVIAASGHVGSSAGKVAGLRFLGRSCCSRMGNLAGRKCSSSLER